MDTNSDSKDRKLHLQQQALIDKLGKSGVHISLPNGYFKFEPPSKMDMLADGSFISLITGVKAAYFCPEVFEDDITGADLLYLIYQITNYGIGIGYYTPEGYHWLVTDIDKYQKLCDEFKLEESEFRVYPQE